MDNIINFYNSKPEVDFSGLSPDQMHQLLHEKNQKIITFTRNKTAINEIPLLKIINSIKNKIDFEKGLKLTPSGNLPVKIVKEIYAEKIILDDAIEAGITKLSKEFDSESIHYARIISTLAGIFRKSRNYIYLTKYGKSLEKAEDLFERVFTTFGYKFNLGYLDGYENEQIAQLGFLFSVYLLNKFGSEKRSVDFYGAKYFNAFPMINTGEEKDLNCYSLRTFERFFKYFGIVKISGNWKEKYIINTEVFNKYISVIDDINAL